MLDFRKGQLDDGETGAGPVDTGVAELPARLFTAGGSTAPIDASLLEPSAPEAAPAIAAG